MNASKSESIRIMQRCPRFIKCSAPICPLDQFQEDRGYIKGEPKCRLSKSKRIKIAEGTDLPRRGMTKREWAAYKHWQSLNNTEKAKNSAHLRAISPFCMSDLSSSSSGRDKLPDNQINDTTLEEIRQNERIDK